jgi:hypothetical protein
MSGHMTIQECHAKNMSMKQAAEAMGVTYGCAYARARAAGLKFRKDYSAHAERMRKLNADPEFAKANAERMRKLNADPEFAKANAERSAERMRKLNADPEFAKANAERMRKLNADPEFNPLGS